MSIPALTAPRRSATPVVSDRAPGGRRALRAALTLPARPVLRAAIAAGLAGSLVVGASSMARPTDAAWTDNVRFRASASAGTWTTQPPATPANSVILPGNQTTSVTGLTWEISSAPGDLGFCVSTVITGTTTTPSRWELRADLDKPPFSGQVGLGGIWAPGPAQVKLSLDPEDPRTMVITGVGDPSKPWVAESNNLMLTSSRTLVVRICSSNLRVPPVGDPEWYTTSVTRGAWTDVRACKVLTVTGRVTDLTANPFFFSWVATLDLTDAKQRIVNAGRTLNFVDWTPNPSSNYQFSTDPPNTQPVPDRYAVTSGRMTALRGTTQVRVTACVVGY